MLHSAPERKKAVMRFMEKHVLAELHPSMSSSAVGQELDANKPAVCVTRGVSKQKHIGSTFSNDQPMKMM